MVSLSAESSPAFSSMVYIRAVHDLTPASPTFLLDHSTLLLCSSHVSFSNSHGHQVTFALGIGPSLHLARSSPQELYMPGSINFRTQLKYNLYSKEASPGSSPRVTLPLPLPSLGYQCFIVFRIFFTVFSFFLYLCLMCFFYRLPPHPPTGIYVPWGQTFVFLVHCSVSRSWCAVDAQ